METFENERCPDILATLHNLVIEGSRPDGSIFKSGGPQRDRFNLIIYEGKSLLASFTLHMAYEDAKETYEEVIEELEHLKSLYVLDLAE